MKTIHWDDGTLWNDPNARWGDPAYLLEPGDPGYVAPVPSNPTQPKRSKMTRQTYYPTKTGDQITWLNNFKTKLPVHATVLGLAAGAVTNAVADCDWVVHVIGTWLPAVRPFAEAATTAAIEAQDGPGTGLMSLPGFTAPAGGTAVNTGALNRIFGLVQDIKRVAGYTDTIGSDLGLIGAELGAPDWNTFAPVLNVTRAPAGVTVGWGWQGKSAFLDLIELQVNRGNGWQLLAYDTTPGYVDTEPIPVAPTKWEYRAIYRVGDQRVGQWSAAASVIVGG